MHGLMRYVQSYILIDIMAFNLIKSCDRKQDICFDNIILCLRGYSYRVGTYIITHTLQYPHNYPGY